MSKYGQIQNNPTTLIIPSGASLLRQIAAAELKFAAHREQCLRDRAYEATAINARRISERRQHDARRYINAGDRP